jgi:hypothetical protein
MNTNLEIAISKVPEVTFAFWVIKILATILGETGGDAVSMSMGLGYLTSTAIFAAIFFVVVCHICNFIRSFTKVEQDGKQSPVFFYYNLWTSKQDLYSLSH